MISLAKQLILQLKFEEIDQDQKITFIKTNSLFPYSMNSAMPFKKNQGNPHPTVELSKKSETLYFRIGWGFNHRYN